MPALAKRWVSLAKKGNSTALAEILKRLYPVPEDDGAGKRVVLEGIKLELTPGGASLTIARGEQASASSGASWSDESRNPGGGATAQAALDVPSLGPPDSSGGVSSG